MRVLSLACGAVLAAGILASPVLDAKQKETETVDRTVPFPDKGTLKLHNFSGDVRITGTSGKDVVIKAVRRAERSRLDNIKLDISTSGSVVTIEANKKDPNWHEKNESVVETDFDIQVPASATLDVNAFSSEVTITGVGGAQKLETFSGRITTAGSKGAVDVKTFSGNVEIDAVAAGASPDLSVDTFSGKVRARLADGAKGSVRFDSFSGSFESDLPLALRSSGRNRVNADLPGGTGATLRFHSFSGDVRVVK
jgi:DUF4097 and DUF4098 domain-containing protein YvlB